MKRIIALAFFFFLVSCNVCFPKYRITLPNGEQVIKDNCRYEVTGQGSGIIVTCGNETFIANSIESFCEK
jgi:hypothetical protein